MAQDDEPTRDAPPRLTARPSETDLRPGGKLGRYTLLEKVGSGGMGEVYAGWDGQLGRRVAIKLIHAEFRGMVSERARLVREARTLAQLQHPNVVSVYELGTTNGLDYVVMEFVEGRTLRQVLRSDSPAPGRVRALLTDAGRGLQALHAAGLVHRDFKPANVLVGNDGRVRLMDFGLARAAGVTFTDEAAAGAPVSEDDSVTELGASPGTPRYMPLEQVAGAAPDARTDQFAFAVAAWTVLTGAQPFPDPRAGSDERRAAILKGPPREQGRTLSRLLEQALRKALAAKPEDRFPTLEPLLYELSGEGARVRRRRATAWASAAAVLLVLALGVWWSGRAARACAPEQLAAEALPAERVARIAAALRAANTPEEAAEVEHGLRAWYGQWAATAAPVCAAEIAGRAADVSGPRACLEARRADAEGVLGLFEEGRREVTEVARATVRALPRTEGCALARPIDVYRVDAASAEARKEARKALGAARAAWLAGDAARSRDAADGALGLAGVREDELLQAEARLLRGRATDESGGDASAVVADYQFALQRAALLREERLEAEAASLLVAHLLDRAQDVPGAGRLLPWASAVVERTEDDELVGHFLTVRSQFHQKRGEFDEGVVDAQRALEAVMRPQPVNARLVARTEMLLGMALLGAQRALEAVAPCERAVARMEKVVPWDHPALAALLNNLALATERAGDNARARALYERALEAMVRRRGPEHPSTAAPLNNLAALALEEGRLDDAEGLYSRARKALAASLGPRHFRTGISETGLAAVECARGDHAAARARLMALEQLRVEVHGRGSEAQRRTQVELARVELEAGNPAGARRWLDASAPPEGALELAERWVLRAVLEAEAHRTDQARLRLEEARAFVKAHPSPPRALELDALEALLASPPRPLPEGLSMTGVGGLLRRRLSGTAR